jgi:hypothetical protein
VCNNRRKELGQNSSVVREKIKEFLKDNFHQTPLLQSFETSSEHFLDLQAFLHYFKPEAKATYLVGSFKTFIIIGI